AEADHALYEAKRSGKNQWQTFRRNYVSSNISTRTSLFLRLREAIMEDRIEAWVQPIFSQNQEIFSVELLSRWLDGNRGQISPALFIGMAQEKGLLPFLDTR